MLTMRSRADLEQQYTRAIAELEAQPSPYEHAVMTGVRDTFAWALGYSDVAPWTGRLLPNPTVQQIFSEWSAAEKVNHDAALRRDDVHRFTYGSTVEHALARARGTDTNAPADLYMGWS